MSARPSTTSITGRSVAAMIAIENTVEGGVSVEPGCARDHPGLRIIGEYLVHGELRAGGAAGNEAGRRLGRQRASGRLRADATSGWMRRCRITGTSRLDVNVQAAASLFDERPGGCRDRATRRSRPPRPRRARREHRRQPERADAFVLVSRQHGAPGPPGRTRPASSPSCRMIRPAACSKCSSSSPPAVSTSACSSRVRSVTRSAATGS